MSADDDARLPRILLAWELGHNFGHVSKTAAVAAGLAGRARLFLAVKDAAAFRRVAPDLPCTLLPAPFHLHGGRARSAPSRSYGDELRTCGWGDPDGLSALTEAWRGLVGAVRPDVIACNAAPTLQLAQRGQAGPPIAAFGTGYETPPGRGPATPRFTFWRDAPEEDEAARLEREAGVVANANAALTRAGAPPVEGVGDLFADLDARFLLTWPELDQYRPRDSFEPGPHPYLGPLFHVDAGREAAWRQGAAKRVFAYIQGGSREYDLTLAALNALPGDWDVILVSPGVAAARGGREPARHVRRFDETVRLDRLLPEMDLGVGHGSFGVASALVSAGVPQLALPRHAEQLMTARALGEAGCGIGFAGEPSAAQISKAMRKLIERPEYRANARALSEKRRDMDCAASAAAVADGLLALA